MRASLPSVTAAGVGFLRGIASLPGAPFDTANDSSMRVLHSAFGRGALRAAEFVTARAPRAHDVMRFLSLGLLDHVALRTLAIDAALRSELARGSTQLVVLGAGLDARAWRMRELARTVVFEVDHPATAALKRTRTASRTALSLDVRFVTVDFEKESLDDALAAGGHDPLRATVWIWEGVTPYLAPAATAATLQVIAKRSAPGSLALVTYCIPSAVNLPDVAVPPLLLAFAVLGEPLRGRMTTQDMCKLASDVGLDVERDTGGADWAARTLRGRPFPLRIEERLVALRKTA